MPRKNTYPLPKQQTETGNCYDLPPHIYDKYFDADATRDVFLTKTAKAICSHCVILEDCREAALATATPQRGVVGGVSANEIRRAKAWRRYEVGDTEAVPRERRPEWLQLPEAGEVIESARSEAELHEDVS